MFISLVQDAYSHVLESSFTTLSRVFKLTQQPYNPFGTQAQLVWHSSSSFIPKQSSLRGGYFQDFKPGSYGTSLTKIKNNGLVLSALISYLSREVKHSPIYEARPIPVFLVYCTSNFKPIA